MKPTSPYDVESLLQLESEADEAAKRRAEVSGLLEARTAAASAANRLVAQTRIELRDAEHLEAKTAVVLRDAHVAIHPPPPLPFVTEKTRSEIDDEIARARVSHDRGPSAFERSTYEQGVVATLRWVVGEESCPPIGETPDYEETTDGS